MGAHPAHPRLAHLVRLERQVQGDLQDQPVLPEETVLRVQWVLLDLLDLPDLRGLPA